MSEQKIVGEQALSALVSDIKSAFALKANSADVYPKTDTYTKTETNEEINEALTNILPKATQTGDIVNFETNVALPLTALSSTIVAQQSGTGTPSPQNVRSISGVSSVGFYQRGVNLWDEDWEVGAYSVIDGSKTDTATSRIRTKTPIEVVPDTQLHCVAPYAIAAIFFDKNGIFLTGIGSGGNNYKAIANTSFTIPENAYYMCFYSAVDAQGVYSNNISINYPSTDTSYHAYNVNSDTFTIQLGQTVYGGIVDAKSGKATITHGRSILDGSDENWSLTSDETVNRRFVLYGIPELKNGSTSIANYLVYTTGTTHDWGTYTLGKSEQYGYYIVLHDKSSNFASTDALKAYLAEHNLELVYELATPVEIDITANNFTTFASENNIFSDCGEVSVEYCYQGGAGTDYQYLSNKPEINAITLQGNMSAEDLHLLWEGTQLQYDAILNKNPVTTYYITDRNKIVRNNVEYKGYVDLTATLAAGNVGVLISNPAITENSTIQVFTPDGTEYTSITVSNGGIAIAFEERDTDMPVKVRVS